MDNNWRFISPVGSSNYVLNPSAEITGNFSAVSGATVTRSTTYQKYGLYAYLVQPAAAGDGVRLTLTSLTDASHFVTFRVRGNKDLDLTIGAATKKAKFIEAVDNSWDLYGAPFTNAEANGQTALDITARTVGDAYIDGVQVEPLSYWTTYIDGTQDGCAWKSAAHSSVSERSSQSRAGGKSVDFFNEYNFFIERVVGAGSAGKSVNIDSYARLPGGVLNSIKTQPRRFTMVGTFFGDSEAALHEKRQALILALADDAYPESQPVRIRFNGAENQKEIAAHYAGGLEADLSAFYGNYAPEKDSWNKVYKFTERATIQFDAPDPYWKEVGESAIELDTLVNDTSIRSPLARFRSTGQWDDAAVTTIGALVRAIVEDDEYVYIGGSFSNFNGDGSADNIARYSKSTGTWDALATLNGVVRTLAVASNGDLYIGGQFTNAGGVANADYLTRWDGSSFNAVGNPNTGAASIVSVNALKFDLVGNLYIGGSFSNWADIANADGIVMWDGSSYSALSTGVSGGSGSVEALSVGIGNIVYLGGDFTSPATYIASWDGSSFSSLGTLDSLVRAIDVSEDGTVYFGGDFTSPANRVAKYNGTSISALGGGVGGTVRAVTVAPDGSVYIGGDFFSVADLSISPLTIFRWNGFSYSFLDLVHGVTDIYVIHIGNVDPVIRKSYDVWVGADGGTEADYAGLVTANNEGSTIAFPKITFTRSGGDSATIATLKNERTGKELFFDYNLLDGETLTIDLDPFNKSVESSVFGSRLDSLLTNSDFGVWSLLSGENDITSFVYVTGSPTVDAFMLWRESYDSYD